jgi:hypothetical protein
MGYLRLIPTVYVVLAAFGGVFIVIATLLRSLLGSRYVWRFWAIYLVMVCASCIYKLSGLDLGLTTSTLGRMLYLSSVALVAVGLPLALGAFILTKSAEHSPLPLRVRNACTSWLAIVAVTPAAVALVAMVDYINTVVVTSR